MTTKFETELVIDDMPSLYFAGAPDMAVILWNQGLELTDYRKFREAAEYLASWNMSQLIGNTDGGPTNVAVYISNFARAHGDQDGLATRMRELMPAGAWDLCVPGMAGGK